MPQENNSEDNKPNKQKRKLMDVFLTREEPDEDYLPELKAQWNAMNKREQIKFILGTIVGLIIVLGGLFLIYLLIFAIRP